MEIIENNLLETLSTVIFFDFCFISIVCDFLKKNLKCYLLFFHYVSYNLKYIELVLIDMDLSVMKIRKIAARP